MNNSEEDKFHSVVKDFMDTDNYQVGQANIPCDNDPKDLIEKLIDFTITDGDLTEKEKSG